MSAPWVWAELELERTSEIALIRRAYARRLKVVHPEDDGPGFQKLRQAYDLAMSFAARGPHAATPAPLVDLSTLTPPPIVTPEVRPPAEPEPEAARETTPVAPRPEPEPTPETRSEPAAPVAPPDPVARLNAAIQRLVALLSTASDPDRVLRAFDEIVSSPAMENLGVETQTEAVLADLIARSLPRADALIGPATARFGWRDDDGARPPSPAVAAVLRRGFQLAHEARLQRLETALTTPGVYTDAASRALAEVLNSPALQDLATYSRTEAWLATLITRNTPVSDPMIEHVVRRFGWTYARTDLAGIQIVLGRMRGMTRRPPVKRDFEHVVIQPLQSWMDEHFGPRRTRRIGSRTYGLLFALLVVLTGLVRTCNQSLKSGQQAPWQAAPYAPPEAANVPPVTVVRPTAPPVFSGPGRVVMSCRVGPLHGLEGCVVVSETPRGRGLGFQALRLAARDEEWLVRAPVGAEARGYVTFYKNKPASLRAEWSVPGPVQPLPMLRYPPPPDLSIQKAPPIPKVQPIPPVQPIPHVQPFSYDPNPQPDPGPPTPR